MIDKPRCKGCGARHLATEAHEPATASAWRTIERSLTIERHEWEADTLVRITRVPVRKIPPPASNTASTSSAQPST